MNDIAKKCISGPPSNRLQPLLRRGRGGQPVDAETSPVGIRALEQVDRVLPGLQHVGRTHPRGHG